MEEEDDDDGENDEEVIWPGALEQACLDFCISLLRDEMRLNGRRMPLMGALAVLGATGDAGYRLPSQCSSMLSSWR